MNRHVVARDHRLRRQIDVLLAQIDRRQTRARVRPENPTRSIEERHNDVKSARSDAAKAAQALDQHYCCLRNDLDGFGGDDEQEEAEDEQYEQQQKAAKDAFSLKQKQGGE